MKNCNRSVLLKKLETCLLPQDRSYLEKLKEVLEILNDEENLPVVEALARRCTLKVEISNFKEQENSSGSRKPKPKLKPISNFKEQENSSSIDYQALSHLLSAQKWREADLETKQLLLRLSGRVVEGWLDAQSVEIISSEAIHLIDKLWTEYSSNRFGFSIQKQVLERLKGQNKTIYTRPEECFGWGRNSSYNQISQVYQGLDILDSSLDAPEGYLPCAYFWKVDRKGREILFLKIAN